jgi:hypothetical protein
MVDENQITLKFLYDQIDKNDSDKEFFEKLIVFINFCLNNYQISQFLNDKFQLYYHSYLREQKKYERLLDTSFYKAIQIIKHYEIETDERDGLGYDLLQFRFSDEQKFRWQQKERLFKIYEHILTQIGKEDFIKHGLGEIVNGKLKSFIYEEDILKQEEILEELEKDEDSKLAKIWNKFRILVDMEKNGRKYIKESEKFGHSDKSRTARQYVREIGNIFQNKEANELLNQNTTENYELIKDKYKLYLFTLYTSLLQMPKSTSQLSEVKDKDQYLKLKEIIRKGKRLVLENKSLGLEIEISTLGSNRAKILNFIARGKMLNNGEFPADKLKMSKSTIENAIKQMQKTVKRHVENLGNYEANDLMRLDVIETEHLKELRIKVNLFSNIDLLKKLKDRVVLE